MQRSHRMMYIMCLKTKYLRKYNLLGTNNSRYYEVSLLSVLNEPERDKFFGFYVKSLIDDMKEKYDERYEEYD